MEPTHSTNYPKLDTCLINASVPISPYHLIIISPYHHITITPYHHVTTPPSHLLTIFSHPHPGLHSVVEMTVIQIICPSSVVCTLAQQFLIIIIDLQYDFMSFFKSKNITFKSLTSFFVPPLEELSSLRYFNGIVISLKIVWSSTPPLQSSTRGFLEGGVVKDSALLDN